VAGSIEAGGKLTSERVAHAVAVDLPRTIAGLEIPQDSISTATWEWTRRRLPTYLLAHSVRSYLWAATLGRDEGLAFEPRILWPAALFHDIGLTRIPRNTRCFEFQGAEVARRFLAGQGMSRADAARVGLAIELHMAGATLRDGAESFLLDRATGVDVAGREFEKIAGVRDAVTEAFPRIGFDARFRNAVQREVETRYGCESGRLIGRLTGAQRRSPWHERGDAS
jgi:hypothetical protein